MLVGLYSRSNWSLNREYEKLTEQREAGLLTGDEYRFYAAVIGSEMAGDLRHTTADDAAVFIDERSAAARERDS